MDKKLQFDGKITFEDTLKMYRRIISIGARPFNIYGLSANNYEKGIFLGADFHFNKMDYQISLSEDNKKTNSVNRLEQDVEKFHQDVTDSQSDDPIVANSPKVRYYQDIGKWDIEDIATEEIDRMTIYKQAEYIPFIGEKFNFQFPFVKNRELSIDRTNGIYSVRLRVDTTRDADKVQKLFYEIVSPITD